MAFISFGDFSSMRPSGHNHENMMYQPGQCSFKFVTDSSTSALLLKRLLKCDSCSFLLETNLRRFNKTFRTVVYKCSDCFRG